MLDLKFIKDNLEAVKTNIQNRFMHADAERVVALYDDRNRTIGELEALRRQRNENAEKMKGKVPSEERRLLVEEGRNLKQRIAELEKALESVELSLHKEAARIPNMAHPQAPVGQEEKSNTELKRVGQVRRFDFAPKDHIELGRELDLVDFDAGTKVAGTKFYFLKNQAVLLELGLLRYGLEVLLAHGFVPSITPDIAKEEIVEGIGFNPRGEESNIYTLEGTGTCLVGTAEITLGGFYADQILDAEGLPIKLAGLSHCFRREAGAAGQFSKGLYRVHQFTKLEMFVYCRPEQSETMHEHLLAIEEQIFSGLDLPFRVVDTCTGDLGAPAYRKFDLEAWMPGRGETGDWGEITSTSNCTDYQARRLKIRYRDGGSTRYVHMLNGTAIAISRALIAILENCQQADGSILIPANLAKYTGFDRIERRR
jgi:seryl-tRNA synthetase